MCNNERFKYLLRLYQANNVSLAEHDELFEMIATSSYDQIIAEAILTDLQIGQDEDVPDLPAHTAHEIVRNVYDANKNVIKVSA